MSYGKFGAKPRGMKNPVYWVGQHLQQQRRINLRANSVERFNEKWHRLEGVELRVREFFLDPLSSYEADIKKVQKLKDSIAGMDMIHSHIVNNINTCSFSELSKYATSIKTFSMLVIKLCADLGVYTDLRSVKYDAGRKVIMIDGDDYYFIG
jgi:hypothetical protein